MKRGRGGGEGEEGGGGGGGREAKRDRECGEVTTILV